MKFVLKACRNIKSNFAKYIKNLCSISILTLFVFFALS